MASLHLAQSFAERKSEGLLARPLLPVAACAKASLMKLIADIVGETEGVAGSLSSRAWKASRNRTEVQDFSRLGRPDYSQRRVEASVDGCLMIWRFSMESGKGAFVFPIFRSSMTR